MWIDTFGKVTPSPIVAGASVAVLVISRRGPIAERDRRDLVDPRHRDQHQRHQQDQAERQRERRTEHEVMPGPEREDGGGPGADAVGRRRQHQGLHRGRLFQPQDRQRHQDADQKRDGGELPVVLVDDRAGPRKLRFAGVVEHAPVGTDAAFERFPGPIHRLRRCCIPCPSLRRGRRSCAAPRPVRTGRARRSSDCSRRWASRIRRSRSVCPEISRAAGRRDRPPDPPPACR